MKKRILVVSSANMDFVMNVSAIPEAGETLLESTGDYRFSPGGKGGNSAIAVQRHCTVPGGVYIDRTVDLGIGGEDTAVAGPLLKVTPRSGRVAGHGRAGGLIGAIYGTADQNGLGVDQASVGI